jgi:hypothetical protein
VAKRASQIVLAAIQHSYDPELLRRTCPAVTQHKKVFFLLQLDENFQGKGSIIAAVLSTRKGATHFQRQKMKQLKS